jgi:hypothetical protein
MPDSLRFWVNQSQDPKGDRLRELLEAQFTQERMQVASLLIGYALVLLGTLVWIAAVRPEFLPSWIAETSEVGWVLGLAGVVVAVIRGRLCGMRARRLAAESEPSYRHPNGHVPD